MFNGHAIDPFPLKSAFSVRPKWLILQVNLKRWHKFRKVMASVKMTILFAWIDHLELFATIYLSEFADFSQNEERFIFATFQ